MNESYKQIQNYIEQILAVVERMWSTCTVSKQAQLQTVINNAFQMSLFCEDFWHKEFFTESKLLSPISCFTLDSALAEARTCLADELTNKNLQSKLVYTSEVPKDVTGRRRWLSQVLLHALKVTCSCADPGTVFTVTLDFGKKDEEVLGSIVFYGCLDNFEQMVHAKLWTSI